MREVWDAIVVGGGPAGSVTARRLAGGGARVLLLDKATHPRDKPCGGGIPLRTLPRLAIDLTPVVEDTVTGIEVSHLGQRAFRKRAPGPMACMVMRSRLDALLLETAAAAGTAVRQGEAVRRISLDAATPRVETDRASYIGRYVIGADGATGIVGRASGLGRDIRTSAAWELEIAAPPDALARWRETANVDLAYRPWGYGWVFPKGGGSPWVS